VYLLFDTDQYYVGVANRILKELKNNILVRELISQLTYTVLSEEYETAPENEKLRDLLHAYTADKPFIFFRKLVKWLHYNSYLSMRYPRLQLENEMKECKSPDPAVSKEAMMYNLEQSLIFRSVSTPLAIKAVEWLRHITKSPDLQRIIEQFQYHFFELFRVISVNDDIIKVASSYEPSVVLSVDTVSLVSIEALKAAPPKSMLASMAYYNGLWNVNGIALFYAEFAAQTGRSANLDRKYPEICAEEYEKTMKLTNNQQIMFFKTYDELIRFLKRLNFQDEPDKDHWLSTRSNYVFFCHPKTTPTIIPDVCELIKSPGNVLYDMETAEEEGLSLYLTERGYSKYFVEYLIENDLTPDIGQRSFGDNERLRAMFQGNKGFLNRFYNPVFYRDNAD